MRGRGGTPGFFRSRPGSSRGTVMPEVSTVNAKGLSEAPTVVPSGAAPLADFVASVGSTKGSLPTLSITAMNQNLAPSVIAALGPNVIGLVGRGTISAFREPVSCLTVGCAYFHHLTTGKTHDVCTVF